MQILGSRPSASLLQAGSRFTEWIDSLWGYDVFIAHRSIDAKDYARGLYEALKAENISCFIDQAEYGPGDSLPVATPRHTRKSTILIVVGTPALLEVRKPVDWVFEEVTSYIAAHARDSKVILIDFGRIFSDALIDRHEGKTSSALLEVLEHYLRIDEAPRHVDQKPSPFVLDAVRRLLSGRRRDKVRIRIFQVVTLALLLMLAGVGAMGGLAWWQRDIAQENLARAYANDSRRLATESRRVLQNGVPDLAALLAREALIGDIPVSPPAKRPFTREAALALANSLAKRPLATVKWHTETMAIATNSPDGKWMAVSLQNGKVELIDLRDGENSKHWQAHKEVIHSAVFSTNSQRLATASFDGTSKVWDVRTMEELRNLQIGAPTRSISFSPDEKKVLTASDDGLARLWSIESKSTAPDQTFACDTGTPTSKQTSLELYNAKYSPDGRWLALGCSDGTVQIFDMQLENQLFSVFRPGKDTNGVFSLAYSQDGKFLAAGMNDGAVLLIEVDTQATRVLHEHTDRITDISFNENPSLMLTASHDATLAVWELPSGRILQTLKGHMSYVTAAEFSAGGRQVLSSSWDYSIRLWNLEDPSATKYSVHAKDGVTSLDVDSSGRMIAIGSLDGGAHVLEVSTGRPIRHIPTEDSVARAQFSRDGTMLAIGSGKYSEVGLVEIWCTKSWAPIYRLPSISTGIASLDFRQDGNELLVASSISGELHVWDLKERVFAKEYQANPAGINFVRYAPKGDTVLIAGFDHRARIFNHATRSPLFYLDPEPSDRIYSAMFSPDGSQVLVGTRDGTTNVYSTITGKLILTLPYQRSSVSTAVFSPNGRYIVTGLRDGTVTLFEAASGRAIDSYFYQARPFEKTEKPDLRLGVSAAVFSPDGSRIFLGSNDGTVSVWKPTNSTYDDLLKNALPGRFLSPLERRETSLD